MASLLNQPLIEQMLRDLVPLGHHEEDSGEAVAQADLGLGFMYYALARILKPERVVAIGSYRGFAIVCFALGLNDNDRGTLDFIDAARVDDFWTHADVVAAHFARFGVDSRVRLHQTTSARYLAEESDVNRQEPLIDLLYIDGDHSFEGVRFDYRSFVGRVRDGGHVVLHDSYLSGRNAAVPEFLSTLEDDLAQMITIEKGAGLTLMKKLAPLKALAAEMGDRQALRSLAAEVARSDSVDPLRAKRLASLVQQDIARTSERERILQSRVRFLTKANRDLRKVLNVLRVIRRLFQRTPVG